MFMISDIKFSLLSIVIPSIFSSAEDIHLSVFKALLTLQKQLLHFFFCQSCFCCRDLLIHNHFFVVFLLKIQNTYNSACNLYTAKLLFLRINRICCKGLASQWIHLRRFTINLTSKFHVESS